MSVSGTPDIVAAVPMEVVPNEDGSLIFSQRYVCDFYFRRLAAFFSFYHALIHFFNNYRP